MLIYKSARPILDWSIILKCLVILENVAIVSFGFDFDYLAYASIWFSKYNYDQADLDAAL